MTEHRDPFATLRAEYLPPGVPPIMGAVRLCLDLAANGPDDDATVRQGWPLTVSAARAVEVIGTPGLPADMVAALAAVSAARRGLILDDDR